MRNLFATMLLLAVTPALAQTGPIGRAIKATQVLVDVQPVRARDYNFSIVTNNFLQQALLDLDEQVYSNMVNIASNTADIAAFDDMFSTNSSYVYADGTTQSVYRLAIRNGWTAPDGLVTSNHVANGNVNTNHFSTNTIAWITSVAGTNASSFARQDAATSFNGYPRIALTTNMASVVGEFEGTFNITVAGSLGAIDGDFDTKTQTQRVTDAAARASVAVMFDLGAKHVGYLIVSMAGYLDAGSFAAMGPAYGDALSAGDLVWGSTGGSSGATTLTSGTFVTNMMVVPFSGRYVGFGGGAGIADNMYFFARELLVYGTTNVFANIDGTP